MAEGRVLVVDDEPMVRETLGQVLKDEGYVVDLAVDGESALARVRAARPDAILLDLMMPGMNGWEFRAAQLADPALADIPVVVLSGDGTVAAKAGTMNAAGFLRKPVELATLLETVSRFC